VSKWLRSPLSTGEQPIENQRRELTTVAERRDWEIVPEFTDEGISGAKGRDKRPGLALQLLFLKASESMGNHDSEIVDAGSVD